MVQFQFEFQPSIKSVNIEEDENGVFLGGSSGNSSLITEPSWCYRLWPASIIVSQFMEKKTELVRNSKIVLEMGAGTGLCSLVASRLGAETVIATDLKKSIPLLYRNCLKNNYGGLFYKLEHPDEERTEESVCRCADGHILQPFTTSSDEYCCNVCESEIDQDCYSCRECNFDCCLNCVQIVANRQLNLLPTWYSALLSAYCIDVATIGEDGGNEVELKSSVIVQQLDWTSEGDAAAVVATMVPRLASPAREDNNVPIEMMIVASDVSYNPSAVIAFLACVDRLTAQLAARMAEMLPPITVFASLFLAHHERSTVTTKLLQEEIQHRNWVILEERKECLPVEWGIDVTDWVHVLHMAIKQ
mmetsp:Transcript_27014/g.38498  ORF Transcript_27014/g.38498 Transcript_27014/m.38498 type:complete len:360 (+) Transcript_27014:42-1121(+)